MANLDSMERIWFDRRKFESAECKFAEHVASEHASLVVEVTIVTNASQVLFLLIRVSVCKLTPCLLVMRLHQPLHLLPQLKLVYRLLTCAHAYQTTRDT